MPGSSPSRLRRSALPDRNGRLPRCRSRNGKPRRPRHGAGSKRPRRRRPRRARCDRILSSNGPTRGPAKRSRAASTIASKRGSTWAVRPRSRSPAHRPPSAWSRTFRRNTPTAPQTASRPSERALRSQEARSSTRANPHLATDTSTWVMVCDLPKHRRPRERTPTPQTTALRYPQGPWSNPLDFDDVHDEGPLWPASCHPTDRLWRLLRVGSHRLPVTAEALSARRSWMASTPSRAGCLVGRHRGRGCWQPAFVLVGGPPHPSAPVVSGQGRPTRP